MYPGEQHAVLNFSPVKQYHRQLPLDPLVEQHLPPMSFTEKYLQHRPLIEQYPPPTPPADQYHQQLPLVPPVEQSRPPVPPTEHDIQLVPANEPEVMPLADGIPEDWSWSLAGLELESQLPNPGEESDYQRLVKSYTGVPEGRNPTLTKAMHCIIVFYTSPCGATWHSIHYHREKGQGWVRRRYHTMGLLAAIPMPRYQKPRYTALRFDTLLLKLCASCNYVGYCMWKEIKKGRVFKSCMTFSRKFKALI